MQLDVKVKDQAHGDGWSLYQGDSCEIVKAIPDRSIGLQLYSVPFSNIYLYSDSERDMANCMTDDEFMQHYSYLLPELYRTLRPGRLCAVHCKDLVDYAGSSGRAGLRDFSGMLIRAHEAAGFKYHSRVTIFKCPRTEMYKTKAHGLLYKTLRADSTFSRVGLPEYMLLFRRWAEDGEEVSPVTHTKESFTLPQWQEWAEPVWWTIDDKNVLNVNLARADKDERHLCPLTLDVIERAVKLWSNEGDVVLSPFAGIGSEGVGALTYGRKFVGGELKPEYWAIGKTNLENCGKQLSLFDKVAANG
jgi:hypothetical protein